MKLYRVYIPLFFVCLTGMHAQGQGGATKPSIKVHGEVTKPITLYLEDLSKMKRSSAKMKVHDGKEREFTGIAIREILGLAGVTTGNELRGKNLTKYLMVRCADGYEVLFSLAELDSSFTDRTAILADQSDGSPLPEREGPFRVVVPGEKRPARSCYQVTEFVIRSAKE